MILRNCFLFLLTVMLSWGAAFAQTAPQGATSAPAQTAASTVQTDNGVNPTGLDFSVGVWVNPTFAGLVSRSGGNIINLASNLGFGNQTLVVPQVSYRFNHGQILSINYNDFNATTQTVSPTNLSYSTVGFPAGTPITSNLQVQWSDINYELPIYYDTYPPKNQYLNVVLGAKIMRGTFQMTRFDGAVAAHEPITEPFPLFGLDGEFRLGSGTSAHFKLTGIYGSLENAVGSSEDIQVGFTQKFFSGLSATADYRYWNFYEVINHGTLNLFAFRLSGPQFSLDYKF